jgi:lipopolysaccharide biosynthesis glycosyltransferase
MGYSRLLVAELLKDIDKIIYLDCDTIVLSDLKELFMTDIENYYIAAVEDAGHKYNIKYYSEFYKNFKIYINAGVLLINLKLWRENNILTKLINSIEENKEKIMLGDQDAINLVCKDKIKVLDFSYNLQTNAFYIKNLLSSKIERDFKRALNNPKIVHYSVNNKPWNSHTHLKKYFLKFEIKNPFIAENSLQFKIRHYKYFVKHILSNIVFFIRFLISPIIKGYRKDNYIKIKIFNFFEFNLIKIK